MVPNPFVAFLEDPIVTLAVFAYAMVLLTAAILTTGLAWKLSLDVYDRWTVRAQKTYGIAWEFNPPLAFYGRLAALTFLLGVDALLAGGIIYVIT